MKAAEAELAFFTELSQMIPDALMLLTTIAERNGFDVSVSEHDHVIDIEVGYDGKRIYSTYGQ